MAAGAVSSARNPHHDVRSKWLLLTLWSLFAAWNLTFVFDVVGWAGRPWYGWWGIIPTPTSQSFVLRFGEPERGGAAARAGLRSGDLIDARDQPLYARLRFSAPLFTQPTTLLIHRGSRTLAVRIAGGTLWEGDVQLKALQIAAYLIPDIFLLGCSLLIALRREWLFEARAFVLILLLLSAPPPVAVPNPVVTFLTVVASFACVPIAWLLLVGLSRRFGSRFAWRRVLESFAYGGVALWFIGLAAYAYGIVTLRFDFVTAGFVMYNVLPNIANVAVTVVALAAIACSPLAQRARVAWLLLPLPLSAVGGSAVGLLSANIDVWAPAIASTILSGLFGILGALAVTYALLKRRVFDFDFVLSRTLVVAMTSLLVVAAFVLLEWVVGSALQGASHATGIVSNAVLVLALGVSLSYIHKWVDHFVDAVLFRKRYEDERALLDFSKEAAYMTERSALLDETLEKIRRHTDARSAAVLIDRDGCYSALRSFGDDAAVSATENDEAVVALKAWHKPLDPHHYATAMHGALAMPMLARGKLVGVLVLGERAGGEAYAPDEVEALSQLAHGVGVALDSLSSVDGSSATAFQKAMIDGLASLSETVRALQVTMEAALRKNAGDGRLGSSSD